MQTKYFSRLLAAALALAALSSCGGGGGGSGGAAGGTNVAVRAIVSGSGAVNAPAVGLSCTTDCSGAAPSGTAVTLSAIANSGYEFAGWSGDGLSCPGTSNCSLTLTTATTVTATFNPIPTAGQCANWYPPGFALVSGEANPNQPTLAKPAKGFVYEEPAFHTCAVRVTNHAAEPPSDFARNDYSRRQAFNADSSLLIVYSLNGFWHVYNANTYAYVKQLNGPAGDAEPQWHPTDPDKLYYLPTNGGLEINELTVSSNTNRVLVNFAGRLPWANAARMWTKSEGSPSHDARYWAFMVETNNYSPLGIVVWDKQTDTIVGSMANNNRPDHLSMSASGKYVVVSWNEGVVSFSRDFQTRRELNVLGEHSDIALDANGDDLYVAVDYQASDGAVFMINLETGVRTDLFATYINGSATALHISGKAFRKPGWVVVSTYAKNGGSGFNWLDRKVMAVQLQANPTIYHLAHHRSADVGYWDEPHASVNRDFTKIVFNSNWGVNNEEDVDTYMIELLAGMIP